VGTTKQANPPALPALPADLLGPEQPLPIPENLPERMVRNFVASMENPNQLSSAIGIALMDGRLSDLLARVDTGESGETWRSLRETYRAAEKALTKWNRAGDTVDGIKAKTEFFQAHETIGALIAEGAADYQAWDEVRHVIEDRRRQAETEIRRVEKAEGMMTPAQVDAHMAAVMAMMISVVRNYVRDRDTLGKIAAQFNALAPLAGG